MDKKTLLYIGFFFIAAIAAFIYNLETSKKINRELDQKDAQTTYSQPKKLIENNQAVTNKKATLLEIVSAKQAARCTYDYKDETKTMNGILYTDGTNARSSNRTIVNDQLTEMNSIITSDAAYIWQSGFKEGIKMDLNKFKEEKLGQLPYSSSTNDFNLPFNYSCTHWQVNPDTFTIPTNLDFIDIMAAVDTLKEEPCRICNAMTDPARKAKCQAALKCEVQKTE